MYQEAKAGIIFSLVSQSEHGTELVPETNQKYEETCHE